MVVSTAEVEWTLCVKCNAKLKTRNYPRHLRRAHGVGRSPGTSGTARSTGSRELLKTSAAASPQGSHSIPKGYIACPKCRVYVRSNLMKSHLCGAPPARTRAVNPPARMTALIPARSQPYGSTGPLAKAVESEVTPHGPTGPLAKAVESEVTPRLKTGHREGDHKLVRCPECTSDVKLLRLESHLVKVHKVALGRATACLGYAKKFLAKHEGIRSESQLSTGESRAAKLKDQKPKLDNSAKRSLVEDRIPLSYGEFLHQRDILKPTMVTPWRAENSAPRTTSRSLQGTPAGRHSIRTVGSGQTRKKH